MPERAGPNPLEEIFGERLYGAAAKLVESGSVTDVRILQGGSVLTGVVGKHRVYIRRASTAGGRWKIEGECNCSERSPCTHVAAVSIAAEGGGAPQGPPGSAGLPGRVTGMGSGPIAGARTPAQGAAASPTRGVASQQQRLLYLLDTATQGIRVTVWVGQSGANGPKKTPVVADTVHPFALRSSLGGTDFPRYVDVSDKEILKALSVTRADFAGDLGGAWDVSGETAYTVIRQIVATGRAFWQSLRGRALSAGEARHVLFTWKALPNGDQQLHCEAGASTAVFLDIEPEIYVDSASAQVGPLESAQPLSLVRRYWQQPAITPEEVVATNERISRDVPFPTLQEFPVRRHALATRSARLDLSAGPRATLYFVYNGLQVDSHRLQEIGRAHV